MRRFWEKVDRGQDCWLWTGAVNGSAGYGNFHDGKRNIGAHRFAYQEVYGPIPEGLDLDHLCRNRRCVNPDHLEPVTRRENLLRGDTIPARKRAQTHCVNGHAFDWLNTYLRSDGRRTCRACARNRQRARRSVIA